MRSSCLRPSSFWVVASLTLALAACDASAPGGTDAGTGSGVDAGTGGGMDVGGGGGTDAGIDVGTGGGTDAGGGGGTDAGIDAGGGGGTDTGSGGGVDGGAAADLGSLPRCTGDSDCPGPARGEGPCLEARCNPATGRCEFGPADDGAPCSDGDACTEHDACESGRCVGVAVACADDNPCTDDGCDSESGCVFTANAAPCEDGDACTVGDRCANEVCTRGADRECLDDNPCTDDLCDSEQGCVFVANAAGCEDGDACTVGDTCANQECVPGGPRACADDNPCTDDLCDSEQGCVFVANEAECEDGDACTVGDRCAAEACVPGGARACSDGNPCTDDTCDSEQGCVFVANEAECEDGDACTVGDRCAAEACLPGGVRDCADGNVCTDDSCDPGLGCVFTANQAECEDGSACTVGDRCVDEACVPGAERVCGDDNVCTDDSCDPGLGCVFTANQAECEDGNACTVGDRCADEACVPGGARDCADDNVCTDDSCDPGLGCVFTANQAECEDGSACTVGDRCAEEACVPGAERLCGDDNGCTDDSCDAELGCVFVANAAECDDGDACTVGDGCAEEACAAGAPRVCNDGDHCTVDRCDSALGCVSTGLLCGDGDPCTTDSCDPDSGCVFSPIPGCTGCSGDQDCEDGNACTTGTCRPDGTCAAAVRSCDDQDACTADSCDPAIGCIHQDVSAVCDDDNPCTDDRCDVALGCLNEPNASECEDGDACTTGDTCAGGRCVAGAPPDCDDDEICTDDSCDPALGCVHAPNVAGCDDDDACTVLDVCEGGVCVGRDAPDCDDDNPCTADACFRATGCVSEPVAGPCDDGDACTVDDACAQGRCVPGAERDCDDGNQCTVDRCDAQAGCQNPPRAGGCEDGSACAVGDTCVEGRCAPGPAPDCDDADPCTDDGCDAVAGCTNVARPDADGDGWCDDLDDCPATPDLVQRDADGDGVGDACDPCGSGVQEPGEACDDANALPGDGCEPDCTVAPGWRCDPARVLAWGRNTSLESEVPPDLGPVLAIDGSANHSIALRVDGTVVAWGNDDDGQCDVPADLADVVSIATDGPHNLALRADGTVVAWGGNTSGECDVPAGLAGVVEVAAGQGHSLALRGDGSVVAWGLDDRGQASPPAGLRARSIAAGYQNSIALTDAGAVMVWGRCQFGECAVPGEAQRDIVAVAGGSWHVLALTAGGRVLAWGRNNYGQCNVPEQLRAGVVAIAGGVNSSLALLHDGTVVAWGSNAEGLQNYPAEVLAGHGVAIGSGRGHHLVSVASDCGCAEGVTGDDCGACAEGYYGFPHCAPCPVCDDGDPCTQDYCAMDVGCDSVPEPDADGDGLCDPVDTCPDAPDPLDVDRDGDGLGDACDPCGDGLAAAGEQCDDGNLVAGDGCDLACERAAGWDCPGARVLAWGRNAAGQSVVPAGLEGVVAVDGGTAHTVALRHDGTVVAWGANDLGQLAVPPDLGGVVAISTDYEHTLALRSSGTVVAWGNDGQGQASVPAGLADVVDVAAGQEHSLAVRTDGEVLAWGGNRYGQSVVPAGLRAKAVAACAYDSAAIDLGGGVVVWGRCAQGLCVVPQAAGTGVVALALGVEHALALKADGSLVAWGRNDYGQAVVPAGLADVVAVAAGFQLSVALQRDGTLVVWGRDDEGEQSIPPGLAGLAVGTGRGHVVVLDAEACGCAPNVVGEGCDACAAGFCDYPACGPCPDCDDGDACNGVEVFDPGSGACVSGVALVCNDDNPCTDDACLPGPGCVFTPNAAGCDDGDACTTDDTCAGGECQAGPALDCDDGNVCTDDRCDPGAGCQHAVNAGPCDDGNPCTESVCGVPAVSARSCAQLGWSGLGAGTAAVCAQSELPEGCSGAVDHAEAVALCEAAGARLCTLAEVVADEAANTGCGYNAERIWTRDGCGAAGAWTAAGASGQQGAIPVACTPKTAEGAVVRCCADADPAAVQPACGVTTAADCSDDNDCTDDLCDLAEGCTHVGNDDPCADLDACTQARCGQPEVSPRSCAELQWAVLPGGSDAVCGRSESIGGTEAQGCSGLLAFAEAETLCADAGARLCRIDELLADETAGPGCGYDTQPVWTSSPCGAGGRWIGPGAAAALDAQPMRCSPPAAAAYVRCCADARTDLAPSRCLPAGGDACDDDDLCTADHCLPASGCAHPDVSAACDDGNPCTDDACDAVAGCTHRPNAIPCDDGNPCTVNDTCALGACAAGGPRDCSDDDLCTADECDPARGCVHDDISAECDDGNPCTDDACVPARGCVATVNDDPCDDGNACTLAACGVPQASTASCAELAWVGDGGGTAAVCAASAGIGGGVAAGGSVDCSGMVDQRGAQTLCEDLGARLCTIGELLADEAAGTGCGYDNVRTWSSTPCGAGGAWSVAGRRANIAANPLQCTPQGEDLAVARCCADTNPQAVAPTCLAVGGGDCADGDPCTVDSCDAAAGCFSVATATGLACDDGNACTVGVCAAPAVSASSCAELEWSGLGGGSEAVCGQSELADGCSGRKSYADAVALCEAEGARLCTLGELLSNEAADTGCAYNTYRIWTSTPCGEGGVWTAAGKASSLGSTPIRCDPTEDVTLRVRCCADADPAAVEPRCVATGGPDCYDDSVCTQDTCDAALGCIQTPTASGEPCEGANACAEFACAVPATSEQSCAALGWVGQGGGTASVCAASEDIGGAEDGGCSGFLGHAAAAELCDAVGARLCTLEELLRDETFGTGCGYNDDPVWTSTACGAGGAWTAAGGTSFAGVQPVRCARVDVAGAVARCCADADPAVAATPRCVEQASASCDDGNFCSVDTCDPDSGCVNAMQAEDSECDDENACTVGLCKPWVGSTKSCAELGWVGHGAGTDAVCGESDAGLVGCSGKVSFVVAENHCTSRGARLCTLPELLANEAAGTGCGYDAELVWSGTPCGVDGAWAAPGLSGPGTVLPVACLPMDVSRLATRCCADADPDDVTLRCVPQPGPGCQDGNPCTASVCDPALGCTYPPTGGMCDDDNACFESRCAIPEVSEWSCAELGWNLPHGSDQVCGETEVNGAACSGARDFASAAAMCTAAHGRLCTLNELLAEETRGTGCGYDSERIWSSTPCGEDGAWTAPGASGALDAVPVECLPKATAEGVMVRCCADGLREISAKTCEELGWDALDSGSPAVCGETPACWVRTEHAPAVGACANRGGRLCTLAELTADEAAGTGCGLDDDLVWTSSPCGEEGSFWAAAGAHENAAAVPSQCLAEGEGGAFIRCCADGNPLVVQPSCVATAGPDCQDGQDLTLDTCDRNTGCQFEPVAGAECVGGECYLRGVCGDGWCEHPTETRATCPADCMENCYGDTALCPRKPLEITFAGTHKSYATSRSGFQFPYQAKTLTEQLDDGIRFFDLDLGVTGQENVIIDGTVVTRSVWGFCDGLACSAARAEVGFAEIRDWMIDNPAEIVLFDIALSGGDATDLSTLLDESGLSQFLYPTPLDLGDPFPYSIGNMAKRNRRLVVFHDGFVPRSVIFKTKGNIGIYEPFSCTDARGLEPQVGQFYVVDHTRVPEDASERAANAACYNVLGFSSQWVTTKRMLKIAAICGTLHRVNVMMVDFYEQSAGPLAIANELNEVEHILPIPYADMLDPTGNGCDSCLGPWDCSEGATCSLMMGQYWCFERCEVAECSLLPACTGPNFCVSDGCSAGYYCKSVGGNGSCSPKKTNGSYCNNNNRECTSGFCYDNQCVSCYPGQPCLPRDGRAQECDDDGHCVEACDCPSWSFSCLLYPADRCDMDTEYCVEETGCMQCKPVVDMGTFTDIGRFFDEFPAAICGSDHECCGYYDGILQGSIGCLQQQEYTVPVPPGTPFATCSCDLFDLFGLGCLIEVCWTSGPGLCTYGGALDGPPYP